MHRHLAISVLIAIAWFPVIARAETGSPAKDAKGIAFFESKIRPVFVEHCNRCHSAKNKKLRGGLSLDVRGEMLKGGDTGPALILNKPDESLLLKAVRHEGDVKMPPKSKLSPRIIADLTAWVRMGAPAPDGNSAPAAVVDLTKGRQFWSFQPVHKPDLPAVKNTAWVRNPIDRFILARLEAQSLTPADRADARTLLRRMTFDLTGLPPTPEDIEAFASDKDPEATSRRIEKLLSSPAHGESWARHWLDVARYAEDQAHTFAVKPNTQAWRYRDWVVKALNTDMPYDRFVKLQIAADMMGDMGEDLAALGFFGLGAQYYKNTDAARAAADELDDRVDTLARGFLALTVSCARCHDHKFDPIPTMDYYSLAGIFSSSSLGDVILAPREEAERFAKAQNHAKEADNQLKGFVQTQRRKRAEAQADKLADYLIAAWKVRTGQGKAAAEMGLDPAPVQRLARLMAPNNKQSKNIAALAPFRTTTKAKDVPDEIMKAAQQLQEKALAVRGKKGKGGDKALTQALFGDKGVLTPTDAELSKLLEPQENERWNELRRKSEEAKKSLPPAPPMAHGLRERSSTDMKVFLRGNPATQGPVAPRRFLRILAGDNPPRFTKGSGRLELAEAIANKANPLTARVIVNRLWLHHFGRGLVGTPSNFGLLGERPSHPELLDWLASELIESGWSLKHIHRLIVSSATYQQASLARSETAVKDPENRLYGRANRRRLEVEAWRDSLLAVTGELDHNLGGPTFDLNNTSNPRRTLYAKISRHNLNPLLRLFDFPDANITAAKRTETTVPQQQLFVMNSPFVIDRARTLASRLAREETDNGARVRRAYALVLGRQPDADELKLGTLYLAQPDDPAEAKQNQLPRMVRYAQILLAENEFLYVD